MLTITEAKRSGICEEGMIRERWVAVSGIAQRDCITFLAEAGVAWHDPKKEFAQNTNSFYLMFNTYIQ